MNKNNKICHPNLRRGVLASAIMAGLGLAPVQAMEIPTGNEDLSIRFDNTLKLNYAQRVESANSKLANAWNNNDGNRNFSAGSAVSQRFDLLTELDVVFKQQAGFRVSASSWYDHAYDKVGSANSASNQIHDGRPDSRRISSYAERYYNGPSGEILDAFVFGSMELGEQSLLSGKLGQHNQFWGETLLSAAHSISYGQAALDLAKLAAVPGTEAKELFVPRNQLSLNLVVNPELSLGAQYFLDWEAARLSESGTYLGGSDQLLNGDGDLSQIVRLPPALGSQFLYTPVGKTFEPDKRGDYGLMAKWSPEWLDGTLGLYYRNTSDILPGAVLTPPAGLAALTPIPGGGFLGGVANKFYVDDIDVYGISLAKNIAGVSVGLDLSYRENMPLLSVPATVAGSPLTPGAVAGRPGFIAGFDGENGVARGNTLHAVLNGLTTFADTPVWDASSLLVELAYSRWLDVTEGENLFKGEDWYRGVDKVSRDNYVLGVNFTPTWFQVFPGVDLSLPMNYNVGLNGNSAVQGGGNEDAGSYAIGIGADLYNKYRFDLKYVDNFGPFDTCEAAGTNPAGGIQGDGASPGANGMYNCNLAQPTSSAGNAPLLKDRGMVTFTFKTTI